MTVGEVRKICDGEPIQLIGSRTGKKLANSWNYADLHIIELPVDVIKSKESLLSDIRFFIKEFTSRMSEEE